MTNILLALAVLGCNGILAFGMWDLIHVSTWFELSKTLAIMFMAMLMAYGYASGINFVDDPQPTETKKKGKTK